MSSPLRVFIGFDSREPVAYHVAAHSVLSRASKPVAIIPLVQDQLRKAGLYTRERGATEATEFSMTRFLVPYLSGYEGVSIFMDCDVVVRCDVHELVREARTSKRLQPSGELAPAVYACQHDYIPKDAVKMDGCVQTTYPRKNWSSVMVFDNEMCANLSPEYVSSATGLDLHRFNWTTRPVGSLPLTFNWLAGEYPPNPDAKILHYTNGGPWFRDYQDCDHAKDWLDEYVRMKSPPMRSFSKEAWADFAGSTRCAG
jgi:hypothetical protein